MDVTTQRGTILVEIGWYFRVAAVTFAALAAVRLLRALKACSVRGVRAEWRLVATLITAMAATYAAFYWLTSWLSRAGS